MGFVFYTMIISGFNGFCSAMFLYRNSGYIFIFYMNLKSDVKI